MLSKLLNQLLWFQWVLLIQSLIAGSLIITSPTSTPSPLPISTPEIKKSTPLITRINQYNFNRILDQNSVILIEFYNPACGVCKTFRPEYIQLAKLLHRDPVLGKNGNPDKRIKVGKVNVVTDWNLALAFNIRLVPTIYLIQRDKNPIKYPGTGQERNAQDLYKWIRYHTNAEFQIFEEN